MPLMCHGIINVIFYSKKQNEFVWAIFSHIKHFTWCHDFLIFFDTRFTHQFYSSILYMKYPGSSEGSSLWTRARWSVSRASQSPVISAWKQQLCRQMHQHWRAATCNISPFSYIHVYFAWLLRISDFIQHGKCRYFELQCCCFLY